MMDISLKDTHHLLCVLSDLARNCNTAAPVFELVPRDDALDLLLFLRLIHNSFLPIPQTGKRNLLNFPDRSVVALSSREMLGALT